MNSRILVSDVATSLYIVLYLVFLALIVYVVYWVYSAIKRIENSLREIEKRLESKTGKDTSQTEPTT